MLGRGVGRALKVTSVLPAPYFAQGAAPYRLAKAASARRLRGGRRLGDPDRPCPIASAIPGIVKVE